MTPPLVDTPRPPQTDAALSLDEIPAHAPTLLTVLDPDGTVQYANPSIDQLLGYDQATVTNEPLADYCHPEDRHRVVETIQRVVSADEQTVETVEYRHRTHDGTYLWVESTGSSTPTPEGQYVFSTRDISAQKQREQELRAENDRLKQCIRFLAHDLRNPISVAQGYLDLADREAPSDHHETVADALDRMSQLIEGLRTETCTDQSTVAADAVDLAAVSERCWQHVATSDSTLEVETDASIIADCFRLMRLFENLFRNSVEHNEAPVRITVGKLDDGFYIEDTGCGIPADKRATVFETGYTTADEGTGLGLEIVTQVVDAHDWVLSTAESSEGGLRVEITGVELVPPADAD